MLTARVNERPLILRDRAALEEVQRYAWFDPKRLNDLFKGENVKEIEKCRTVLDKCYRWTKKVFCFYSRSPCRRHASARPA